MAEASSPDEHEQERRDVSIGRRSVGQPTRVWGDAVDGRRDLGLAT
jgi:hypothetical protein